MARFFDQSTLIDVVIRLFPRLVPVAGFASSLDLHTACLVRLARHELARCPLECRKTKEITLTNHNGPRQYSEPIKTRSKYV